LNFQWRELSLTLKGWRNGFGKRLFFCDGRRSDRKEMNLKARWRDQAFAVSLGKIDNREKGRWTPIEATKKVSSLRKWFLFFMINKKPQPSEERLGFETAKLFTAFHRRPIVKRIQAGLLTCGSSYGDLFFLHRSPTLVLPQSLLAPSHPSTSSGQWLWQVSSPLTAAWPSSISTRFPLGLSTT
jgi:hypothetical protein